MLPMNTLPIAFPGQEKAPRKWYSPSLTSQIMLGLILGGLLGWLNPALGIKSYFLRDIFLNLIKSIIAPLIFSTHCRRDRWRWGTQESGANGAKGPDLF